MSKKTDEAIAIVRAIYKHAKKDGVYEYGPEELVDPDSDPFERAKNWVGKYGGKKP